MGFLVHGQEPYQCKYTNFYKFLKDSRLILNEKADFKLEKAGQKERDLRTGEVIRQDHLNYEHNTKGLCAFGNQDSSSSDEQPEQDKE